MPRATRRFFISLREAGQICLLAAACAEHRHLLIPRLDPQTDLQDLEAIAIAVLRHHGFEPRPYQEEAECRQNFEADRLKGRYPLLLTPLDTSGEKPFEEFVGEGEIPLEIGMPHLQAIRYRAVCGGGVASLLVALEELLPGSGGPCDKSRLVALLNTLVPEFRHRESSKSLDGRM